jgi:PAS domain-containing protein
MEGRPAGKHIVLICARELAVNLATPLFIVDERGTLVFFNEAAERLLGRTFGATGDLPADEWMRLFEVEADDGVTMPAGERPITVALEQRVPAHRRLVVRAADGARRTLIVTAYPLMPDPDRVVGAVAIFWEVGHLPAS